MMLEANKYQVAGSHYYSENGVQHWDIVVALGLCYFGGQISRYVLRHRKKNGLEDLRKAEHYCIKWYEIIRDGSVQPWIREKVAYDEKSKYIQDKLLGFLSENEVRVIQEIILGVGDREGAIYRCKNILDVIHQEMRSYPDYICNLDGIVEFWTDEKR